MDGIVKLNGRDAVKLGWTRKVGPAAYGPTTVTTLWVDATTYVPLRLTSRTIATRPAPARTIDATTLTYQVIPATAASLKALTPPIPAGFTRAGQVPGYRRAGR